MTEGSEFFLSKPQFITSISDINVYRKTSITLLRPSNTKKKIRNEKRFLYYLNIYLVKIIKLNLVLIYHLHVRIDADRITEVVTRLPETLQNEEISIEEAPPTADVASPSTSTDKSASLYDWLQNPKIKTNSVQVWLVIIKTQVNINYCRW